MLVAFRFVDARSRLWRSRGLFFLLGEPKNALCTYGIAQTPVAPVARRQARPPVRPPQTHVEPRPTVPVEPPRQIQQSQRIPFDKWPEQWQRIASQCKPGLVAWSYPHLGYDLCHVETTDLVIRRQFFSRIFSEQPSYPPGTYTFWPYALPNADGELVVNRDIFLEGLLRLKAGAVILLGEEAGLCVAGTKMPNALSYLPHGIEAVVFQDIAKLRESAQLYNRMMGTGRTNVARHGIFPLRSS